MNAVFSNNFAVAWFQSNELFAIHSWELEILWIYDAR
jgi:hypothetical protein